MKKFQYYVFPVNLIYHFYVVFKKKWTVIYFRFDNKDRMNEGDEKSTKLEYLLKRLITIK